jgi:hypothetical protein
VSLKGQASVGIAHAHAIVNDLYESAAIVSEYNLNRRGTGIDGILNQFFDDRSGAMYHLASRDLVGYRIWQ